MTSRVDSRDARTRFGTTRGRHASSRNGISRTPANLRALATRRRHAARNAVHHAGSSLHHHRRVGSVRRHSHIRHRHRHRHRVVFVPITYYVYPVPPSIGYQDDIYYVEPYCPPEEVVEEYYEYDYGPAPYAEPALPPTLPAPYAKPEAPAPEPVPQPAPQAGAGEPSGFELGVEAFQAADYRKARLYFRETVDADAEDGEAWMALMFSSFMLERFDEAAEALARAAALEAFPRGYRFDVRALFAEPATFDAALERLYRENQIHPRNMDAWLLRAYFHVAAGEITEAQSAIQRVLLVRRTDTTAPVLHTALLPPLEEADAPAR
ncbi:MAG: tetratricopeptide repeat protein [Planctomycetota bacterium]|nr:tetratricopeptide repeat protein [Planctomycetota bacterium]